jgi:predicted nucleic acid-binding protein
MLVVSDTSPISNLALIDRLELLHVQFGEVRIPPAVKVELAGLPVLSAKAAIEEALGQGWLRTTHVEASELVRLFSASLHPGESEAIALGVELRAGLVLIDEREARDTAALLGLRVTGVLGVLPRAKREGAIDSLRQEIDALRTRARFFIASQLEQQILSAAGE